MLLLSVVALCVRKRFTDDQFQVTYLLQECVMFRDGLAKLPDCFTVGDTSLSFSISFICIPCTISIINKLQVGGVNQLNGAGTAYLFQVNVVCQFHVLCVNTKNFQSPGSIRDTNVHLSVKSTWSHSKTSVQSLILAKGRITIFSPLAAPPLGQQDKTYTSPLILAYLVHCMKM